MIHLYIKKRLKFEKVFACLKFPNRGNTNNGSLIMLFYLKLLQMI